MDRYSSRDLFPFPSSMYYYFEIQYYDRKMLYNLKRYQLYISTTTTILTTQMKNRNRIQIANTILKAASGNTGGLTNKNDVFFISSYCIIIKYYIIHILQPRYPLHGQSVNSRNKEEQNAIFMLPIILFLPFPDIRIVVKYYFIHISLLQQQLKSNETTSLMRKQDAVISSLVSI